MNAHPAPITLRFFFDWGCTLPLWPGDQHALDRYGFGPVEPTDLGLSADLAARCEELSVWWDTSLNWDYPPDPGPWTQDECDRFNRAATDLFRLVEAQLGPNFCLLNQQPLATVG